MPEIDIWRAPQLMLKRSGDKALEATAHSGHEDGMATWRLQWLLDGSRSHE
jgi:hypothetical protein